MKRVSIRAIVLSVLFTLGAAYTSTSIACNWTDRGVCVASSKREAEREYTRETTPPCSAGESGPCLVTN
jgi:hypothetical protein